MKNALTVDVEDYFQVSAFEDQVDRESWTNWPSRAERNTHAVMDLFAEQDAKATFFVLGWVAEHYPALVHRMVSEGHEVASHGMEHCRVTDQTEQEFREDAGRTRKLLQDISGEAVIGYRAASFSISDATPWAHDVLADLGYVYSSSIYPIQHDHYGSPDSSRVPYEKADKRIQELPVTTVEWAGRRLPAGGGGYFRLLPYGFSRWAWRKASEQLAGPAMIYFHPWEIDSDQPRLEAGLKTRFRHYVNLSRMRGKLQRALRDFEWGRMDEAFNIAGDNSS